MKVGPRQPHEVNLCLFAVCIVLHPQMVEKDREHPILVDAIFLGLILVSVGSLRNFSDRSSLCFGCTTSASLWFLGVCLD